MKTNEFLSVTFSPNLLPSTSYVIPRLFATHTGHACGETTMKE